MMVFRPILLVKDTQQFFQIRSAMILQLFGLHDP
jgi:hypothetical protein